MGDNLDLVVGNPGWPSDATCTLKEVKVKKGFRIYKGQVVATIESQVDKGKPVLWRIKAKEAGKVAKVNIKPKEAINENSVLCTMEPACTHPTLMKDMCAECGADLRQDESITDTFNRANNAASSNNMASISMVHSIPELKVSSDEAKTLGREDEVRLRRDKKLVLLVDLDQTLIHTTNENVNPKWKEVYHFQMYGPRSPWYHTRVRPFTKTFLEKISKLYELHICTFGVRLYAHTIANFLDPERKYFSHRILSRDECFDSRSKTANLSSLFPCGDHMVCIIDDREDVWKYAPNLVHVKPYNFFKNTGDINAPPGFSKEPAKDEELTTQSTRKTSDDETIDKEEDGDNNDQINEDLELSDGDDDSDSDEGEKEKGKSGEETKEKCKDKEEKKGEKDKEQKNNPQEKPKEEEEEEEMIEIEETDDYLIYLEEILTTIHKAYYDLYQQMQDQGKTSDFPDLKTVIPYVKRKILQGANIVFSGIVPTHKPLRKSRAFLVTKSMGANITENVVTEGKEKTTHVIAARPGTAKVNLANKLKDIQIVTPNWLWSCAERWERIDERLFPLSKDAPIVLRPPAHCSSPEIAFAERCDEYELFKANSEQQQEEGNQPEAKSPRLSFSDDDLKSMDKEIDDVLSEESSSDEDENGKKSLPPKLNANDESSSSEDSLGAEEPKGWAAKRQKMNEEDDDDESEEDNDDEDGGDITNMAAELEREFLLDNNSNSQM